MTQPTPPNRSGNSGTSLRPELVGRAVFRLVISVVMVGLMGYLIMYNGVQPAFGAFDIIVFVASAALHYLALRPGNLETAFVGFAANSFTAGRWILIGGLALGVPLMMVYVVLA